MNDKEIKEAKEISKKCMKTTGEVLKVLAEIGNGVYTGGMWALCTAVPVVGIPLKICAAVSGLFIHGWITTKTNALIDDVVGTSVEIFDQVLDNQIAIHEALVDNYKELEL